jgi:hypothetical protein
MAAAAVAVYADDDLPVFFHGADAYAIGMDQDEGEVAEDPADAAGWLLGELAGEEDGLERGGSGHTRDGSGSVGSGFDDLGDLEDGRGSPATSPLPLAAVKTLVPVDAAPQLTLDYLSSSGHDSHAYGGTSDSGELSDASSSGSAPLFTPTTGSATLASAAGVRMGGRGTTQPGSHARPTPAGKASTSSAVAAVGAVGATAAAAAAPVVLELGAVTVAETDLVAMDMAEIQRLSGMQLTKAEERSLKRLRRRVMNKLSAASSRQKKRDYLAGLEERAQVTSRENAALRARIQALEAENRALRAAAACVPAPVPAAAAAKIHPALRADVALPPPAVRLAAPAGRRTLTPQRTVGAVLMVVLLSFGLLFPWTTAPAFTAAVPGAPGAPAASSAPAYMGRRLMAADAEGDGPMMAGDVAAPPWANLTEQLPVDILPVVHHTFTPPIWTPCGISRWLTSKQ